MLTIAKNLYDYRELLLTLAWKNVTLRYKQAYLGIAWAILKPLTLMLIFTLVRSFVGIDSGEIPYPILTFAALMPWTFFQESTSEGVNSVVGNTALIKKIYFPREIFPITSVLTKLVELGISFVILAGLMLWYGMMPTAQILWVPLIILYTVLAALTIAFCRCRGERVLPRRRASPAGAAVTGDVRLAGHLPAATGQGQAAGAAGRGRVVGRALHALHAEPAGGHHRRVPERRAQGQHTRLQCHDPRSRSPSSCCCR